MENNLIKNETAVFYTVELSVGVGVIESSFYGGKVEGVKVTRREEDFYKYGNAENAKKVAEYIGGKVIKRTWTTVVTEITEEIKGDK